MQVTLDVPENLAKLLGDDPGSLGRAALEGLALEGLRSGRLTVAQARQLLGIPSRDEMDGFLKAHGVLHPLTVDDVEQDLAVARAFQRNG